MTNRLIVGCGYVGQRIARLWQSQGDSVYAITRADSRAHELAQTGIIPIVWDWLAGGLARNIDGMQALFSDLAGGSSTVLISVSHAPQPNVEPLKTHTKGLENLLPFCGSIGLDAMKARWIYLSTTGVFGHSMPGEWVDEESPVLPERPGSIAAYEAEQWIAKHIPLAHRVVLRPVGIYGPGRVPRWQAIRDQVPLQVDPESYLNLIHVDDLAAFIQSVSNVSMREPLYCVSDGSPVTRREYYEYIAKLGNWPAPVFDWPPLQSLERKSQGNGIARSDGNKRVRNDLIQSELRLPLQFPSYREGLRSLVGT